VYEVSCKDCGIYLNNFVDKQNAHIIYQHYFGEYNSCSLCGYSRTPSIPVDLRFKAEASSVYKLKHNTEYTVGADMAVDNNLETAWNEGASGTGIGEWIKLTPSDKKEYIYYGFKIANGFQYHTYHKGDRWVKNNRVASLDVYADGTEYVGTFYIYDNDDGYQYVDFSEPIVCKYLVFIISSVWMGDDFSDTCISEIRPY